MWAKTSAFLIWAAAAACAVFWALRLGAGAEPVPAHAQPAPLPAVASADLSRILGKDPAAAAAAASPTANQDLDPARFQLLGVIAAGPAGGGTGWATISVDGKPARTYRVGSVIDGTQVLQKVAARGVEIGPRAGQASLSLKLTGLPAAATGRLGGGTGAGAASTAVAVPGVFVPQASPAMPAQPVPPPQAPGVPTAPAAADASQPPAAEAPSPPSLRRPGLATR